MTLQEALEKSGYKTLNYSGRGMFGRKCLAAKVASLGDLWVCGNKVGQLTVLGGIYYPNIDNYGLELIVYWPQVEYTEPQHPTPDTFAGW